MLQSLMLRISGSLSISHNLGMRIIALFAVSLLLAACGTTATVNEETAVNSVSDVDEQPVKSEVVQFFLSDPAVERLKLGVQRSDLERRLIEASLEPQVTASSNLGAASPDGDVEAAATVQVGLTKDADFNGVSSVRIKIIDHQEEISRLSVLSKVNERVFSILNSVLSTDAMDRKIELIDAGLNEYESVKGLIEASQKVGAISKGKVLEIKNQVAEVQLLRSQFDLARATERANFEIETGEASASVKRKLRAGVDEVISHRAYGELDPSVIRINMLSKLVLENNLSIEESVSEWSGNYSANVTSARSEELTGFVGIQLFKPVYDAGQSQIRQELILNQIDQSDLELADQEKKVKVAFEALKEAEKTLQIQTKLNSEKLDNLVKNQEELEIRKAAGKANLEEQAQGIVDIANARIKLIDLKLQFEKAKLEYLLLNQTLYSLVLNEDEVTQLLH